MGYYPAVNRYFREIEEHLWPEEPEKLTGLYDIFSNASRIFIVGNGGSSAIAGHVAEDYSKICNWPTVTFNDVALISCLANDYGWDQWVSSAIKCTGWGFPHERHVGIFISSSGKSKNIINGCIAANNLGITTITLTGFEKGNPLSCKGHHNLYVPSSCYNVVEMVHEMWLLSLCEVYQANHS